MTELARVTDASYLDGVADHTLAELRARRTECQDLENALSFVRRIVQGRLDIVAAETARRREGAAPESLAAIIDRLPSVLADRQVSTALPRPPLDLAPSSDLADALLAEVDADLPPGGVGGLVELTDAEVDALADRLRTREQELSLDRRRLHEVIDVLHAEIIRRYESGEATVESLLR